jgi:Tol biopolymer transport system component
LLRFGHGIALALLVSAVGAGGSAGGHPTGTLAVLAEAEHESGGINYPSDVYVVDVDGKHLRNLTHDKASDGPMFWLRDGRHILFESQPSDPQSGTPHLYVIRSDGTGRRRITSKAGGSSPSLSPDGRRVAFLVERKGRQGLYVMNVDGTHMRRLTRQREGSGAQWLPDGKHIALFRGAYAVSASLFVIGADGRGLVRVARFPSFQGAAWSPKGRLIAVEHATASGNWLTIAEVRPSGQKLTLSEVRTIGSMWPGAWRWTPDGRRIVYQNDAGVWIVEARAATPRRRFAIRAYLYTLTWSPDQRWVAFSKSRVLRTDPIEVARATGRERHIVTRKICCLLDQLEWAPR